METGRRFGQAIALARKERGWPHALAILLQMEQLHVPIDVLHGNAVLSSFVDDARGPAGPAGAAWRWGGQLLAALVHRRVQADTRSFNILRSTCRWLQGLLLLELQTQRGLAGSEVSRGCTVNAYAKAACWSEALRCLASPGSNVVHFGAALGALGAPGAGGSVRRPAHWAKALEVLKRAEDLGL
ncbi:unnamed protein product, partial [Durusdinium trenchii]